MPCYVYYSYEEWGRGYIGVKMNSDPETDGYYGSYQDKTFNPTCKVVLGVYETPDQALKAEIELHNFFSVDINPHFANQARQTSTGFISLHKSRTHRENISKSLTGRKLSPESIAKRQSKRVYATGEEHHMVKHGHTPEVKAIIKEKRSLQINIPGKGTKWWVNKEGKLRRTVESPGEGWQQGKKWQG